MLSWLQVSTVGMQSGLQEREHRQLLLNPSEPTAPQDYVRVWGGTHRAHRLHYFTGWWLESKAPIKTVLVLYTGILKASGALF